MTLLNADGSLLSKEIYKYEFDFLGNWNKMTTSVAVVDARGITFEPTEVTYRSIMYYLDENMLKSVPGGAGAVAPSTTPVTASTTTAPTTTATPTKAAPDPKPVNTRQDARNRKNVATAPELPTASNSATQIATLPVEMKTTGAVTNQQVVVNLDAEPPPAPGPRPILKPVSGGVLNGTALSLPQPIYPEAAKRMRTAGMVTVEVVLDETGKVVSATATSGPSILRDAAIQAALKAKFSPTKLSGQPVKVSGVINYKFALLP